MPQIFASSVGVGRAEPEWAALNKVAGVCGVDQFAAAGEKAEGPLPLPDAVRSGDVKTAPRKVDLLIVGAGLSGAVLAERCSKELGMTSLILETRDHIGGNCYDYLEEHGLRASKYGGVQSPAPSSPARRAPPLPAQAVLPPFRASLPSQRTSSTPSLSACGSTCSASPSGCPLTTASRGGWPTRTA